MNMIEIIKNDKVLQMFIIAFMACVAYWVFIIRVPRRIFKETEREKHDEAYWEQVDARLNRKYALSLRVRKPLAIRKPNYQARRLRMSRGRRS